MGTHTSTPSFSSRLRFAAVLACALLVVFSIYIYRDRQHNLAIERNYQSRVLGDELRQASDELTRLSHAYIRTGNPLYKEEYMAVRAALDGKQPLSDSLATSLSPRQMPPIKLSNTPGFDTQLRTEAAAMAMVESATSNAEALRIQASQLLEDAHYQNLKLGLLQPMPEHLALVEQRTRLAMGKVEQRNTLVWFVFLLLGLGLLLSLWRTLRVLRTTLGGSLDQIHGQILSLGKGDFTDTVTLVPSSKDSVLGWLLRTQRQLGQIEAERTLNRAQREQTRQKDGLRNFMVERLTSDLPLGQILEDFVRELENQLIGAHCAILLLDVQSQQLKFSAAPNLPDFFNLAMDGIPVGPRGGGCAAAAFTGQRVITQDIATDPDWAEYQELAHRAGLVSCWSEPIRSGSQKILGSFAIFHRTPSQPQRHELELLEMAARLTALAIERKRTETQLQLAAKVFEQGSEGIVVTDSHGRIVRVNHAFSKITGYTEAEALGRNPSMLSSGRHDSDFFKAMWSSIRTHGQWQGEIWNRRKDGAIYPERLSISSLLDSGGAVANYVAVSTDITKHKKDEEHIRQLVDFDPLTGLPNRQSLGRRVDSELLYAQRSGEPLTLMFLDLDRFKNVNDSLGHHIGDELLIQIARRLQSTLRDEDTVYRLGGDEFVVLCPGLDATAAAQMATQVLKITAQGYSVAQHDLVTTFSIGIALYPTDGDSFETLSRSADTAMYRAKQAGRNTYRFFTAHMQVQSSRALQLENGLRRALELHQMHLVYQPQVSLHDGRVVGMEALLRWEHPTLGPISPSEFIPVAEDSGLILSIGEWVLRTAAQQLRAWLDAGLVMHLVSVNLSVVQFRHANLPELITQVLLDTGLPPQCLELELTEGVAMDDPLNAIAIMDKLSQCGVRLSIDDFGTGYSSLSYLKRFSVYKLKIDQSFVRDITHDTNDKAIVVAIIALARSMGFKTIAEGVETQGQLDFLREQGCDDVQGYFYSKPLLPAAFEAFVRQHQSP